MPLDDNTTAQPAAPAGSGQAVQQVHDTEPLSCMRCRARKLRCDRMKPACARCARVKGDCVYPDSRKRPIAKRQNAKELEKRLAQVEGMLRDVTKLRTGQPSPVGAEPVPTSAVEEGDSQDWIGTERPSPLDLDCNDSLFADPSDDAVAEERQSGGGGGGGGGGGHVAPPSDGAGVAPFGELIGLDRFEMLPPMDMIEDLHRIFFDKQAHIIPILHQSRYLRSFYSAPHMRPPMCLQYAVWTMAARTSDKYAAHHDIFYRRCRRYLDSDELRGDGEHFVSVAHAQAWALMASYEARGMYYTRGSMSIARCARLTNIMGFHRLDKPGEDLVAPAVLPPQSWVELEERRRLFWAAFCIDSHASISTGWSNVIDHTEITTHLPSSEEAYALGKEEEEETCTLQEALNGSSYSSFGVSVVSSYLFMRLLKHVYRPAPADHPEDLNNGPFWKRHREIDNLLSNAFMSLPECYRLPKHTRDPVALQINLNLHASVIYLHDAARINAGKYNLPDHVRQTSQARVSASADEVVHIMRLAVTLGDLVYRSPLAALALYLSAYVHIGQAKENPGGGCVENLDFLLRCMVVIGRQFKLTHTFVHDTLVNMYNEGIMLPLQFPFAIDSAPRTSATTTPLFARVVARPHGNSVPVVPPGRLPLDKPQATTRVSSGRPAGARRTSFFDANNNLSRARDASSHTSPDKTCAAPGSKRKRTSSTARYPEMATPSASSNTAFEPTWFNRNPSPQTSTAAENEHPTPTASAGAPSAWSFPPPSAQAGHAELPDRSGSYAAVPRLFTDSLAAMAATPVAAGAEHANANELEGGGKDVDASEMDPPPAVRLLSQQGQGTPAPGAAIDPAELFAHSTDRQWGSGRDGDGATTQSTYAYPVDAISASASTAATGGAGTVFSPDPWSLLGDNGNQGGGEEFDFVNWDLGAGVG